MGSLTPPFHLPHFPRLELELERMSVASGAMRNTSLMNKCGFQSTSFRIAKLIFYALPPPGPRS